MRETVAPVEGAGGRILGLEGDVSKAADVERWVRAVDAARASGRHTEYDLIGLDGLGEDSNTNLMLGVRGSVPNLWYYFGIKSGKLGAGAEWERLPWFYKAELADPNDLRFNLRFGKKLFENSFLMFGWESVFKRDSMSIGVLQQY